MKRFCVGNNLPANTVKSVRSDSVYPYLKIRE